MTIQECYQKLGGDYTQAKKRLSNDLIISKFIGKFLDDKSFCELCYAMQEGQRKQAFCAAHTLKGVCANLSFNKLSTSVSLLTDLLRPETDEICEDAFLKTEQVKKDYDLTVGAIREYLGLAD